MRRGIRLFKVIDIQVTIDYTWFIVFALVAWSLAEGYFPYSRPDLQLSHYWFMGGVSSLLLFASVLFHELCHSYVAKRLGVDIKEITLFIFGGVARLTREPDKADEELKIAIAGPLSSFFLAGLFWLFTKGIGNISPSSIFIDIFRYIFIINIILAVFNLIPGFPLDGGRVLRALWWWKTDNIQKATHLASDAGKVFAMLLIFFGILQILSLNLVGGIWAILIGMFLRQAAESSYQQVLLKKALWGVRVDDIMTKNLVTVQADLPLNKLVEEYFFLHSYVTYPVLKDERLLGLISLEDVRKIPRERWHELTAGDVISELKPESGLSPQDTALEALERMITSEIGRLIVQKDGRLIGMVTRRDIMKLLEVRRRVEEMG